MMAAKDVQIKQAAALEEKTKSLAQQKHDLATQQSVLGTREADLTAMQQSVGAAVGKQQARHEAAMGGLRARHRTELGGLQAELTAAQARKKLVHKKEKVPTTLTPAQLLGGAPQGFAPPAQQDPRLDQATQMIHRLQGQMNIQRQQHGHEAARLRAQRNSDHAQLQAFSAGQASQHQQYNQTLGQLQQSLAQKRAEVSGLQTQREQSRTEQFTEEKKRSAEELATSRQQTQAAMLTLQQYTAKPAPKPVSLAMQPTGLGTTSMGDLTAKPAPAPVAPLRRRLQPKTETKFYEHRTQEQLSGGAPAKAKPQPIQQQLADKGISGGTVGQPKTDTPAPVRPKPVLQQRRRTPRTVPLPVDQPVQKPVQQRQFTGIQDPRRLSRQKQLGGLGLEDDEKSPTTQPTETTQPKPFSFTRPGFIQQQPTQTTNPFARTTFERRTKQDQPKIKPFEFTQTRTTPVQPIERPEDKQKREEFTRKEEELTERQKDVDQKKKDLDKKIEQLKRRKLGIDPPAPDPSDPSSSSGSEYRKERFPRRQRRRGRPGPEGPGPGPPGRAGVQVVQVV